MTNLYKFNNKLRTIINPLFTLCFYIDFITLLY